MKATIWHNPRCSKSRQTLAILEENGVGADVRLYLQDPPGEDEIRETLVRLGIPAIGLVRTGEAAFKDDGLTKASPEDTLIAAMVRNPILIERPVVIFENKAALGRPPEAVLALFSR